MSTPSLTLVATGTTSVLHSDPVVRFQQAVEVQLAVADLERRVQHLARQLTPVPQVRLHPNKRSVHSACLPQF